MVVVVAAADNIVVQQRRFAVGSGFVGCKDPFLLVDLLEF